MISFEKTKDHVEIIRNKVLSKLLLMIQKFEERLPLAKIIVFECESDLDDNPRAYYEYLITNQLLKQYKFVWLVKDPAYCQRYYQNDQTIFINRRLQSFGNQIKLYYFLRRASCLVFSHPYWYRKKNEKQLIYNLWHGIPIKKGTDSGQLYKSFDYVSVHSETAKKWIMEFLNCTDKQTLFIGAPRNDLLFTGDRKKIINKLFNYADGEKVIICMPTYRRSVSQTDCPIEDKYSLSVIHTPEEMLLLNKHLKECNIHLIIKPHPLQITKDLSLINHSNIHYINNQLLLDKHILLYELLGCTDGLISDFSSVTFDYLLLNKPIGYLLNDYDVYSRGFIMDNPQEYMTGKKIYKIEDLFDFITEINEDLDIYSEDRKKINKMINTYAMKDNCRLFHEHVISHSSCH